MLLLCSIISWLEKLDYENRITPEMVTLTLFISNTSESAKFKWMCNSGIVIFLPMLIPYIGYSCYSSRSKMEQKTVFD